MFDHRQTYTGVSRIEKEYFRLLCRVEGLAQIYHDDLKDRWQYDFSILPEADQPGKGETFAIEVKSKNAYDLMQKVFDAANG